MRSAFLLLLLPLAACASAGPAASGSSVPGAPATAAVSVAQQCEDEGFAPGSRQYQRCYAARSNRQDSSAYGAMNLFRTIGPIRGR